ncbi:LacI family DNA-binding transcriptional regulator [Mucilaginibacter sp. SJ]|uniref:LacI family DNA-binding transcriptional regulator n=1 Tax=Mucilaginibacter sp. SJ TaxID=3029053 RepID=UPI0023A9DD5A|nr:LacI family DNA-binding transcriptional regulator [Mucilaginibacter sp. SJ]WEA00611.1 LacI family DNA-binding transcriptional regulator [Mucilaginibacter sp. SJ]
MAKKISIGDIAKALGVSTTSVSFVISGRAKEKGVSAKMIALVENYIKEIGYKPNLLAQSLRTGKTMTIGLMVEMISDYFFSKIAYHIEGLAYANGYKILYCSTDNDAEKTAALINLFMERKVDGFIITPPAGIENEVKNLMEAGVPVVLFDRYFPEIDTNYVILDNFNGTYKAIKELIRDGFRKIAYIGIDSPQTQMNDREGGYLKGLEENSLPALIKRIPFGQDSKQTVKDIVKFMKANKQLEAVVFATNYLALSGIQAFDEAGLKIPDDVAVVAFDDHMMFDLYRPTITAIAQPIEQLAKQAFDVLLSQLNDESQQINTYKVVVPPKFIIRDSTEAVKNKKVSAVSKSES